jgi:peroxiredoxin family protein
LACEGAATLEDLRAMEAKGVSIQACGACLNYYELTEKLAVGSVTNMDAIATTMAEASKLVNL